MNNEFEMPSQMQATNPELGYYFYDPEDPSSNAAISENSTSQAGTFAEGFLKFLAPDTLAKNISVRIINSEELDEQDLNGNSSFVDETVDPHEQSDFEEVDNQQAIIIYPSHSAVYFPAQHFANEIEAQDKLQHFKASSTGNAFSSWVMEKDIEAYASQENLPMVEEVNLELEEMQEFSKDPSNLGINTVMVYCHVVRSIAAPLWPTGKGEGVKVAVLDTGIDFTNALLMRGSFGGASMVPSERSYMDYNGHGTHVSGIIASRPSIYKNGLPLYWSIAPYSKHYTIKVLDRRGVGAWSWITRGIDRARVMGVDIINMSLGSRRPLPEVAKRAIQKASHKTVIVAAAGNSGPGSDTVNWPARYREVIGVGAINCDRKIARFSSRGPSDRVGYVEDHVECVAPGVDIYSNQLNGGANKLTKKSGTSMASPVVAGICALLKQKDRKLQGTNAFRYRLRRSFIDLGIFGPDNWYGLGQAFFHARS